MNNICIDLQKEVEYLKELLTVTFSDPSEILKSIERLEKIIANCEK